MEEWLQKFREGFTRLLQRQAGSWEVGAVQVTATGGQREYSIKSLGGKGGLASLMRVTVQSQGLCIPKDPELVMLVLSPS